MRFQKIDGEGYIHLYARTDLNNKLHDSFNFNIDTHIVGMKKTKEIIKIRKNPKNIKFQI